MRKLLITLILISVIITSCHHNDEPDRSIENNVNIFFLPPSVVDQIEIYGQVDGESIGYGGIKSEQYKRYEILKKYSEDSLIALTNHKSPAVRVYAFDALTERKSRHVFQIFETHIADTARFIERSGCIGLTKPVNASYLSNMRKFLSKEKALEYTQKISAYYSLNEWGFLIFFGTPPPKQIQKKSKRVKIYN